jgi:hypothetical protein
VWSGIFYKETKRFIVINSGDKPIRILSYSIGKNKDSAYGLTIKGERAVVEAGKAFTVNITYSDDFTMLKGVYPIWIYTSLGLIKMQVEITVNSILDTR